MSVEEEDKTHDASTQARALRLMGWYPWFDEEDFTAHKLLTTSIQRRSLHLTQPLDGAVSSGQPHIRPRLLAEPPRKRSTERNRLTAAVRPQPAGPQQRLKTADQLHNLACGGMR